MRVAHIKCKVRYAWWWKFYVAGVVGMARLTGLEPDYEKVTAWAKRAVSIEIIR